MSFLGFSFGKSKNKSSGQYANTRTSTPITTPGWQEGLTRLNAGVNDLMAKYGGGVSADQQAAIDRLTGLSRDNKAGSLIYGTVNPALGGYQTSINDIARNANYSLTGATPQVSVGKIAAPGTIEAGTIATPDKLNAERVSAETAFSMAQPYREAYGTGVLDPTLADYDTGVSRAANAYRAGTLTTAPNTRQTIGSAVLAGEAARGRAATEAAIRSDILSKAFGFGGSDATLRLTGDISNADRAIQAADANARFALAADTANVGNRLAADTANVGNRIAVDTANVGNQLTGDTFNAGLTQQDRLTNLDAQIKGDATKLAAFTTAANLVQQQGANALAADTLAGQQARDALAAAGVPLDQALALIQAQIEASNAAVPGFGQTDTESGTQSGTTSGSSFGFSAGR